MPGGGKTTAVSAVCARLMDQGVRVRPEYVGRFDLGDAVLTAAYLMFHPAHWHVVAAVRSWRELVMLGSFLRRERRRRRLDDAQVVLMDEGPVNGAAMLAAVGGPRVPVRPEPDVTVLIEISASVAAERTRIRQQRDPSSIVSSTEYLVRFAHELDRVIADLGCPVVREVEDDGLIERLAARLRAMSEAGPGTRDREDGS